MNFLPLAKIVDGVIVPNTFIENMSYLLQDHVVAAIAGMGAIVAVVIGGFFAFMLIRKALQWARRAI